MEGLVESSAINVCDQLDELYDQHDKQCDCKEWNIEQKHVIYDHVVWEFAMEAGKHCKRWRILNLIHLYHDINSYFPDDNKAPLHLATQLNDVWSIRALCRHGADINLRTNDVHGSSLWIRPRFTPLQIAVDNRNAEAVKVLCKLGADLNVGFPLHMAIEIGKNIDAAKSLCEHGIDVNARYWWPSQGFHYQPLLHAVRYGDMPAIRLLLDYGAHSRNEYGEGNCFRALLRFARKRRLGFQSNEGFKNKIGKGLLMILSSGCCIELRERRNMYHHVVCDVLKSRGILQYAERVRHKPQSLKRLSKFALRDLVKKPLKTHVKQLGLPQLMEEYLCLQVHD